MTDSPNTEQARDGMLRELYTDQLATRIAGIAARLRSLADEIDREAERVHRVSSVRAASASNIAHDVVHTLTWGFANLHMGSLVQAAADFDREVLGGRR
jgi:hypothetical protein